MNFDFPREDDDDDDELENWNEVPDTLTGLTTITGSSLSHPSSNPMDVGRTTITAGMTGAPGSAETGTVDQGNNHVNRMDLNTNKAGMQGLDKERINKIILEASKGSRFYENEQKKDKQVNQRIQKMLEMKSKIKERDLAAALDEVDKLAEDFSQERDLSRSIVHIDMDMFYAAVEMLEKPDLREKPMAVGGTYMLSTSNYVARRYGVRAGMPGFIGKKLCPDLVMVPLNFSKYKHYSTQVREILAQYDPNFSPMGLDEAYLDFTEHVKRRTSMSDEDRTFGENVESGEKITGNEGPDQLVKEEVEMTEDTERTDSESGLTSSRVEVQIDETKTNNSSSQVAKAENLNERIEKYKEQGPARCVANPISRAGEMEAQGAATGEKNKELFGTSIEEAVREMRFRIQQKTKLTASAGIAPNCMLAKIASDMNKPNGQFVIKPTREEVMKFVKDLPIRKVSGIGKVTEKILSVLGVKTCTDLFQQRASLHLLFSPISSHYFLRISLGLGSTELGSGGERKSVSTERTFGEKSQPEELYRMCEELSDSLAKDLEKKGLQGKTVTLKIKTVKFEVKSRAQTLPHAISSASDIFATARGLLKTEIKACRPHSLTLRLMGVRLSSFLSEEELSEKQKQISLMSFLKRAAPDSQPNSDQPSHAKMKSFEGKRVEPSSINVSHPSLPQIEQSETLREHELEHTNNSEDHFSPVCSNSVQSKEVETFENKSFSNSRTHQDSAGSQVGECLSSGRHKYSCPVCDKTKFYKSLEDFNRHVDVCLNRGAISSILKSQADSEEFRTNTGLSGRSYAEKRPGTSLSSSTKRLKSSKGSQSSTLDKFFKKGV